MGSFAPQPEPHSFELPWIEAPSGFVARGDYKGKGLVIVWVIFSFWMVMESSTVSLTIRLR